MERKRGIYRVSYLQIALCAAAFLLAAALTGITAYSEVPDYDKRVEIWSGDRIPGNSNRSKLEDMNYFATLEEMTAAGIAGNAGLLVSSKYSDQEKLVDSSTYLGEIRNGMASERYDDRPYLIPYPVPNAKGAIIFIPGGGYMNKSVEDGSGVERDICLAMNARGYSTFLLWYRSNPYEYPIPQLDLQRAIRYVRAHLGEYGVAEDHIYLLGASAGAYQAASFISKIRGTDQLPKKYVRDAVDRVSDQVEAVGMVYPQLTFRYNVPALFALYDEKQVKNPRTRARILDSSDLSRHFQAADLPLFISYGTNDHIIPNKGTDEYIRAAQAAGTDVTIQKLVGQPHGFPDHLYYDEFMMFLELHRAR